MLQNCITFEEIVVNSYSKLSNYDAENLTIMLYCICHQHPVMGATEDWHNVKTELKQALWN